MTASTGNRTRISQSLASNLNHWTIPDSIAITITFSLRSWQQRCLLFIIAKLSRPIGIFELLDECQASELLGMRRLPLPGRNLKVVFQLYFQTGPIFNGGGATRTLIYISLFRLYRLCDVEGLLLSYPTLYIFFCYTSSWSLTHILLISLSQYASDHPLQTFCF